MGEGTGLSFSRYPFFSSFIFFSSFSVGLVGFGGSCKPGNITEAMLRIYRVRERMGFNVPFRGHREKFHRSRPKKKPKKKEEIKTNGVFS